MRLIWLVLNKHNESHWRVVKRIITHLIQTVNIGIEFRASETEVELVGYSDADFASNIATRRSTTGYVFCMANGMIFSATEICVNEYGGIRVYRGVYSDERSRMACALLSELE